MPDVGRKEKGSFRMSLMSSPGGSVVKGPSASARDTDLILGLGRSRRPQKATKPELLRLHLSAHKPQLPKPARPRTRALQQERPPQ